MATANCFQHNETSYPFLAMQNFKATTDFSSYPAADLGPQAQSIHNGIEANLTTFDKTPITMPDFQTNISDMLAKLIAKDSGAYADTLAFNLSRALVEENLGDLGNYVNIVAKGDETTLMLSNFPYYSTSRTPDYSAPGAPTNVQMKQGDSGSFILRYRATRRPATNQVQTCLGDPMVEDNWKTFGFFTCGRATVSGITPGTLVWARVRTIGLLNVMGAWSDLVKLIVI